MDFTAGKCDHKLFKISGMVIEFGKENILNLPSWIDPVQSNVYTRQAQDT